jgi:hypothetical protein
VRGRSRSQPGASLADASKENGAARHVLVMGLSGWLQPAGWPGGLPPISLLAFIAALIPVLVRLYWTATYRAT